MTVLRYGSKGDEVKKLQKQLNAQGYSLDVDGSFGPATQSAVKSYQKKNGLSVDGVVGSNTWGSLNKNSSTQKSSVLQSTAKKTETKRPTYNQSASVTEAQNALKEWEAAKPVDYSSPYTDKINAALDRLLNGEKFTYDFDADPVYQQYRDKYVKQGKMAMEDTMAGAAALSGGYGSSYGTAAAAQAYQQELDNLNDIVPELQEQAYQAYIANRQQEAENLGILQQQDAIEYGKYRDEVNDYNTERDYLYGVSQDEKSFDYNKYLQDVENYENDRTFTESQRQFNKQMAYQQERDKIADEQWQKEFNLAKSKSTSSGRSSSSGSTSKKTTISSSTFKKIEEDLDGIRGDFQDANGKIGANYRLAEKLDYYQKTLGLSESVVDALYEQYCYDMPAKK